ncbi:MAG: hypothetical protein C0524_14915 [Rhodobacter sp.]|nr:hypothetical protein [Rhodobacter sp.]
MRKNDSGHGGKNPERALLAAIVLQAIEDLDDPDETARYEAHEFFLQPRGGWADQRRFFFDALGLDERRVLASLRPRLSPPERPEVRLTFDVLYRDLPRVPFSISDLIRKHRRGYSQLRGLIQTCEDKGLVVPTGRGVFCRVDCLPPPDTPKEKPLKKPASVKAVVYALLTEPRTFKDLIIATGGDVSDSVIRTVLREGRDSFELSRDDDGRYLIASHST